MTRLDVSKLFERKTKKGASYFVDDCEVILAKKCTDCLSIKALDDFAKHKKGFEGRASKCKECDNTRRRQWSTDNKEHAAKTNRRYYLENIERCKELSRDYHHANKEKANKYSREWAKKNQKRKQDNNKKWYEENRQHCNVKSREWHENNKARSRELNKIWRERNPDKKLINEHRRLARKRSLPDDFTLEQMVITFEFFGRGCALTGEKSDIQWDHLIPLSCGYGGTTFGNMIPLKSDLNFSKNGSNFFEWFDRNQSRFNLSIEKFLKTIDYIADINGMTREEYHNFLNTCFENKKDIVS